MAEPLDENAVLEVLRTVRYPNFSRDIVSFGLVKGIRVHGDIVSARFELATNQPEILDRIKIEAEEAIRRLPGVGRVLIETKAISAGPAPKRILPEVRRTVAVASGKGGVGKSTVAVNLAVALAQEGLATGLLDADIYGPSVPLMTGTVGEAPALTPEGAEPIVRYGVRVMSIGYLLARDSALVWRGPMVMKAVTQLLEDVHWASLDYLIVDLPPGTGDAQLTLSQAVTLAGAVIVTTPQDVALIDAVKGVSMFRKVNVPILGLIENMSTFVCPHCGQESDIFSRGGARREAERLGVPFLGEIPIDPAIRLGGDRGEPIAAASPDSPSGAAFRRLARSVVTALDGAGAAEAPGRSAGEPV